MGMFKAGEMNRFDEIIKLVQENPDLPVVAMVDFEVVADDFGHWMGSWGYAEVDEYLVTEDRVLLKSEDDVFDALERYLPDEEFYKLPEEERECRPYYEALPWKKAILVYINPYNE